ncbi:MAG: molybdate ABC transporter substrate-binding protein [Sulfitobacter sp.]
MSLALLFVCVALPVSAQSITVFAAASLRDALTEAAQSYPEDVTFSFAGSGTLARQVAADAPADAIVLAHRDWANWLDTGGFIMPDSLRVVAGGQLVLIGAGDADDIPNPDDKTLTHALAQGRLAMGQRDGVPAGTYAREWLTHIGAWQALNPQLAETDNVRAALALVAAGAAPLGIVYASDALAEPKVKVLYTIPPNTHAPIRYPAAALTPSGHAFVTFLTTPAAARIFQKHGLTE